MGWAGLIWPRTGKDDRVLWNTVMNFHVQNVGTVLHGVSGEISYLVI
jgi:hypothetical protein